MTIPKNGDYYDRSSFEYKNYTYYVLYSEDCPAKYGTKSYPIVSTAEDFEHVIFDQEWEEEPEGFSNFKFWLYNTDENENAYRIGNMGYAYTLRNVQMQDGSYATITIAVFSYYSCGFRVWIQ